MSLLTKKTSSNSVVPKSFDLFAVKILSKYSLIKAKQVDHVFNEMML